MLKLDSLYNTPIFTLHDSTSAVKNVYGASFSGSSRAWRFPAYRPVHEIVLSDLRKCLPDLVLASETQEHVRSLSTLKTLPEDFRFITQPYQHQYDGLLHAYDFLRSALFYAPGLGKCKITVDLNTLTHDKMLVLCPRVMLDTWSAEFKKHGNITDVIIIEGTKLQKIAAIKAAQARAPAAVIVTYTTAALYLEELQKIAYDAIVADESHQLKTPFSKRTQAATQLAQRAYRRVLLSGTPSLGSPFDMYAQLRFLGPYFCKENWWDFRKKFGVYPESERNEKVPKILLGFQNIDVINARVNLISLRKTKEECLDLPERQIIDMHFALYAEQKRDYNKIVATRTAGAGEFIREQLLEGTLSQTDGTTVAPHVIADEVITLLGKVDQLSSGFIHLATRNPGICNGCTHMEACSSNSIKPYTSLCHVVKQEPPPVVQRNKTNARLDHCQELLETILEDDTNKVIIWANYHAELDDIETILKAAVGSQYVRVQGGMSSKALASALSNFNTDPKCRVYLGQVSTGVGVTLNAATYMIYYNLPWSLEHYLQSIDRNYRIGQINRVTVYRLLGYHTLDESKSRALDQKLDFTKLVTSTSVCATCSDFYTRCNASKVKLYDLECKYDRTMLRHTAVVGVIP